MAVTGRILSFRASDAVFIKSIRQFSDLLRRACWETDLAANDPQIAAYARANHFDLLAEDLCLEAAERLESAALTEFDVSFFGEGTVLPFVPPIRLVGLGLALRTKVLPSLRDRISEVAEEADLDEEPDGHFKKLLAVLDRVEEIGVDSDAACLIDDARDQVTRAVTTLEERKRERDEESKDDTDWTHIVTQRKEDAPPTATAATKRSVFDDVDR